MMMMSMTTMIKMMRNMKISMMIILKITMVYIKMITMSIMKMRMTIMMMMTMKMTTGKAKTGRQVLSNECYGANLYQRQHLLEEDKDDDDDIGNGDYMMMMMTIHHHPPFALTIFFRIASLPPSIEPAWSLKIWSNAAICLSLSNYFHFHPFSGQTCALMSTHPVTVSWHIKRGPKSLKKG